MKDNSVLNTIWFRLIIPPLYGLIVYLLVLLIFDTLEQLRENFLGQEVILTISLTYCLFFILHLNAKLYEKYPSLKDSLRLRISLQFITGMLLSILLSSFFLLVYFRFILGFTQFARELIVFNSIFLLSAMLYNLFYFSIYFLNEQNIHAVQQEQQLNESIYEDFIQYQRDIRPEFFFSGLETLIVQIKTNRNEAQKFIDKFSSVYRYFIDNRLIELVDLKTELKHIKNVIRLFSYRHADNLIVEEKIDNEVMRMKLVPCTMHLLIEEAFFTSIINDSIPLNISMYNRANKLYIEFKSLKKIIADNYETEFEALKKTFSYYSDEELHKECKNETTIYTIPLIPTDDKNLVE